ncbi:hypothetical protein PoB_005842300 [Plakobranchus ocellatus]|uniref:Uncharacterized protein n=1 Tax=Plakobranchus ocellatus TaxID=259542 RepID=A0AAV4CL89_9GAST|nr:hypothetical protein PoB_005842300 [Plakobranchus ocellatus]
MQKQDSKTIFTNMFSNIFEGLRFESIPDSYPTRHFESDSAANLELLGDDMKQVLLSIIELSSSPHTDDNADTDIAGPGVAEPIAVVAVRVLLFRFLAYPEPLVLPDQCVTGMLC